MFLGGVAVGGVASIALVGMAIGGMAVGGMAVGSMAVGSMPIGGMSIGGMSIRLLCVPVGLLRVSVCLFRVAVGLLSMSICLWDERPNVVCNDTTREVANQALLDPLNIVRPRVGAASKSCVDTVDNIAPGNLFGDDCAAPVDGIDGL